ncbi:putative nuclease HARBI1 [Anoplophora glabripennis]|uniref:putative nuclease HARBI1 n=1 Tax=Anoplophora glabripennis TaxID=217634 RepID=UPI000874DC87|nr:putative nuclease HARBI1 [Anoplophora glabripennis]
MICIDGAPLVLKTLIKNLTEESDHLLQITLICQLLCRCIPHGEVAKHKMNICKCQRRVKITTYRQIIDLYDDQDFQNHFRVNRKCIDVLVDTIRAEHITIAGRPTQYPIKDAILLTIWTLANQESFRGIADRFGVSRSQAWRIVLLVVKKLYDNADKFISWLQGDKALATIEEFKNLRQGYVFPNVIGCVDGSHINIPAPSHDNSYYNRKGTHSILLQGVCNAKKEFIDVSCGWPGSMHDARMWQESPLYEKLSSFNFIPANSHLLGDSAYPIKTFIMVPFKDNGHLTQRQRNYNMCLSKTRVVIEQAFGMLKGCWRRLKFLNMYRLQNMKYMIICACILHNIRLKYVKHNINIEDNPEVAENDEIQLDDLGDAEGRAKRNYYVPVKYVNCF